MASYQTRVFPVGVVVLMEVGNGEDHIFYLQLRWFTYWSYLLWCLPLHRPLVRFFSRGEFGCWSSFQLFADDSVCSKKSVLAGVNGRERFGANPTFLPWKCFILGNLPILKSATIIFETRLPKWTVQQDLHPTVMGKHNPSTKRPQLEILPRWSRFSWWGVRLR